MTRQFITGAVVVALASFLAGYGMFCALDGRTVRRLRLAWASVRAWLRGDKAAETEAYLRGCHDGYNSGRCQALKEAHTRERALIARAYAAGWNNAVQALKVRR